MPFDLKGFEHADLTPARLSALLDEHARTTRPALERLWAYYRNPGRTNARGVPTIAASSLAQAQGLPTRLRPTLGTQLTDDRSRGAEVVIENDIAWRLDAMVDFVFGKPLTILSAAEDPALRPVIERVLDLVWENSGGVQLFQDTALLGGVYGFADLVVRTDALFEPGASWSDPIDAASRIRVELIEPTRAVPVLDPGDYRVLDAYAVRSLREDAAPNQHEDARPVPAASSFASRLAEWIAPRTTAPRTPASLNAGAPPRHASRPAPTEVIEVLSAERRRVFAGDRVLLDAANPLGVIPVVHAQNASQPFAYAGVSDVEPLIPLQDELNTRLSDRAHRVTMQSFNMYLAKGLEGFGATGVGPGQVWSTDNPDASVQAFGGDASAPSEQAHIEELRDAMDKASGVSPVALGVIRAKLGHLSSENALRITLNGVLSKTARKRVTYGRALASVCRLILLALDRAGALPTSESDRAVRLQWQDPLPLDERARLNAALLKRDLGVPTAELLAELGYARTDAGVT